MSPDRRKHVRRDVNYRCWIGGTGVAQLIKARVRNISAGGAKVVCPVQNEIPDTVDLYMTQDGKIRRRCKVVWRSEDAMGLMFVTQRGRPSRHRMLEI